MRPATTIVLAVLLAVILPAFIGYRRRQQRPAAAGSN